MPEEGVFYIVQDTLDERYSRDPLTKHCRPLARAIFAGTRSLEQLRELYGLTVEEFGRVRELPPYRDEWRQLERAKQAAKEQGHPTSGGK